MAAPDFDRFYLPPNNEAQQASAPQSSPTPGDVDPNDPNRLAVMLDAVSAHALTKLDEFLTLPIDTSDGNRTRAQSAAINTALATQAKVDELKLRARHSVDLMPKIIKMLKEEQEKLRLLEGDTRGTTEMPWTPENATRPK
jgi:hypothetical protein